MSPPLSDDEKSLRRFTLGSSEIAAVVGVNPYASMHDVWCSKMGLGDFDGNEATELGNALEPAILSIYSERYARQLRKGKYTVGAEDWISATPDSHIIIGGGIVEAKLVGLRSIWQWGPGNFEGFESDAAPLHHIAQTQWQLMVTGEPFADIAALMGTEFRTYRIRPDAKVQAGLLSQGRDFWTKYVLTKTPPPVDGSDGAKAMLAKLYPRTEGSRIRATPELNALAESLRHAREHLAQADEAKTTIENQMKEALGSAPGAYSDKWQLRYAHTKKGTRPFVFEHEQEVRKGRAA